MFCARAPAVAQGHRQWRKGTGSGARAPAVAAWEGVGGALHAAPCPLRAGDGAATPAPSGCASAPPLTMGACQGGRHQKRAAPVAARAQRLIAAADLSALALELHHFERLEQSDDASDSSKALLPQNLGQLGGHHPRRDRHVMVESGHVGVTLLPLWHTLELASWCLRAHRRRAQRKPVCRHPRRRTRVASERKRRAHVARARGARNTDATNARDATATHTPPRCRCRC